MAIKRTSFKEQKVEKSKIINFYKSNPWHVTHEEDIHEIQNFEKIRMKIEELKCEAEMLCNFDCCTLKTISLLWNREMSPQSKAQVYKFLSKQKNLQHLKIKDDNDQDFFNSQEKSLDFGFRLKSFQYFSGWPLNNYINLIVFLSDQRNSLTSLDIEIATDDLRNVETLQKYIMENMLNLKDLRWEITNNDENQWITTVDENIPYTQVTKNIERLSYNGPQYDLANCKRFIDLFPNLKHLQFKSDMSEPELLKYVSQRNIKLESLELLCVYELLENLQLHFPNLIELFIFLIIEEEEHSNFISRHSKTLERITIWDIFGMTELTVNAIKSCDNLKYIKLGNAEMSFSNLKFLNEFKYRTKPLTVKIEFLSTVLTFEFPEDKIFWADKLEDLEKKLKRAE